MTIVLSVPGQLTRVERYGSDKTYLEFLITIDAELITNLIKLVEANTPLTITIEAEETNFTTTGIT